MITQHNLCHMSGMSKQRDAKAKGCHSQWDVKAMGCQSNIGNPSLVTLGVETNETELETRQHLRE